jgi:hypothetical protein
METKEKSKKILFKNLNDHTDDKKKKNNFPTVKLTFNFILNISCGAIIGINIIDYKLVLLLHYQI